MSKKRFTLEHQFQRKLYLPGGAGGTVDPSGGGQGSFPISVAREDDCSVIAARDPAADSGSGEVGAVQDIEEFRAELQLPALSQIAYRGILRKGEIQGSKPGSPEEISPGRSQKSRRGDLEGSGIEIAVGPSQNNIVGGAAGKQIRPVNAGVAGVYPGTRAVAREHGAKGQAALNGNDAAPPLAL